MWHRFRHLKSRNIFCRRSLDAKIKIGPSGLSGYPLMEILSGAPIAAKGAGNNKAWVTSGTWLIRFGRRRNLFPSCTTPVCTHIECRIVYKLFHQTVYALYGFEPCSTVVAMLKLCRACNFPSICDLCLAFPPRSSTFRAKNGSDFFARSLLPKHRLCSYCYILIFHGPVMHELSRRAMALLNWQHIKRVTFADQLVGFGLCVP